MTIYARKGEIITCYENGHSLYRLVKTVDHGERMMAAHVEPIAGLFRPKEGDRLLEECPYCGSPWWYKPNPFQIKMHFEDGWR